MGQVHQVVEAFGYDTKTLAKKGLRVTAVLNV